MAFRVAVTGIDGIISKMNRGVKYGRLISVVKRLTQRQKSVVFQDDITIISELGKHLSRRSYNKIDLKLTLETKYYIMFKSFESHTNRVPKFTTNISDL